MEKNASVYLRLSILLLVLSIGLGCTQSGPATTAPEGSPPSTTPVNASSVSQTASQPANNTVSDTTGTAFPQAAKQNTLSWADAKYHMGEYAAVCGAVTTVTWATTSKGQPTFINIGNAYPNPNRFTALIWGENRKACESKINALYNGKNVCITGVIKQYNNLPEIEVTSPAQIEIR